ncbi:MAG: hypothetical protein ACKER6_00860 [Candidatus Hodgkinia cicadicola]
MTAWSAGWQVTAATTRHSSQSNPSMPPQVRPSIVLTCVKEAALKGVREGKLNGGTLRLTRGPLRLDNLQTIPHCGPTWPIKGPYRSWDRMLRPIRELANVGRTGEWAPHYTQLLRKRQSQVRLFTNVGGPMRARQC